MIDAANGNGNDKEGFVIRDCDLLPSSVCVDLVNVNINNDIFNLTFLRNDDVKHFYTPSNSTRPVVFCRGFVLERLFNLKRPFW